MKRQGSSAIHPHQHSHSVKTTEKRKKDQKKRRRQNKQQRVQGVENWRNATADSDNRHKAKRLG